MDSDYDNIKTNESVGFYVPNEKSIIFKELCSKYDLKANEVLITLMDIILDNPNLMYILRENKNKINNVNLDKLKEYFRNNVKELKY